MFEDSVFDSANRKQGTNPFAVGLSLALQCVALAVLIVIPLIYTEALPRMKALSYLLAPQLTPKTQATAPIRQVVVTIKPQPQQELTQPTKIPEHANFVHDEPLPPAPAQGFVGVEGATGPSIAETLAAPIVVTPPPPPVQSPTVPVPVGGDVMAARLIYQVKPIYPALGRQVRVQGTVRLRAIIDKDGSITNLTVLSGHPLLIPAAIEAVKQWRYQPTKLNGVPVEVETTVDVNFILGG